MSIRRDGMRLLRRGVLRDVSTPAVVGRNALHPSAASFASSSRCDQEKSKDRESQAAQNSPSTSGGVSRPSSSKTSTSKDSAASAKRAGKAPNLLHFDVDSFPSLLREPHPVLDAYDRHTSPPTADKPYTSTITFFNSPKYFRPRKPSAAAIIQSGDSSSGDDIDSGSYLQSITPLSAQEVNGLHRHLLKMRRVVQQTGKGRFARMAAVVVTGNGRGLVGYGEGKDINAAAGVRKAFHAAVKTMDFVERHNGHTIPAEVSGKWSATKVFLRPRPPGFGLHVPPVIHAIARCAGITDLSASIIGSTNPLNVAKATLSILWGGSAPQGMGDGVGGAMRRADKGVGARSIRDLEMARGRRLREIDAGR